MNYFHAAMRIILTGTALCILFLCSCGGHEKSTLNITRLRCEYRVNPHGLDVTLPRLSWELVSEERNSYQSAYRILVASTPQLLDSNEGDLWDSGKVNGNDTAHIEYGGVALGSRDRCWWKVMNWDRDDTPAVWSEPSFWSIGLLGEDDWKASWIGMIHPNPEYAALLGKDNSIPLDQPVNFRRPFDIEKQIESATVYATARGVYTMHLNGKRVGEDYLTPGWTQYNERLQYQSYDVTGMLESGANVLGAVLAEGWYCGHLSWQNERWKYGTEPSLCAQMIITYTDGTEEIIGTDVSWTCTRSGPIRYSSIYKGERYDARMEMSGWNAPGFNDDGWNAAAVLDAPGLIISAQLSETVRKIETIKPIGVTEPAPGVYVFDMGQNFIGWIRLKAAGQSGTEITLRHAERLNPDGTFYTENLRGADATDTFILAGTGDEEIFEPHFTFHGFQYVEVTGYPGTPDLEDITGIVVHSDTPRAGQFVCSDPLVNRLYENIIWGQKGNFLSVPTDCPQRDERLGWTGDAQTFVQTSVYNMDVAAFFTKWMVDVTDAQSPDGPVPDVVPSLGTQQYRGQATPAWSDTVIIVPYTVWRTYGDIGMLETHWDAMDLYMDDLLKQNPAFIRKNRIGSSYGDWLSIKDDTPKYLLATAFWAYDAQCMIDMAEALGKTGDAARYRGQYEAIKSAFQSSYAAADGRVFPQNGDLEKFGAYAGSHDYTGGIGESQTGYLLALAADLVPDGLSDAASGHLVRKIRDNGWCLSSGFVGIRFLNPVLTQTGHNDVAYRLLLQDAYPSWLYPVKNGATTIWERWDGWTAEKGFQDPGMNSFNHYSLGSVGEWLYGYVAGIRADKDHPGFSRFIIDPYPGAGLDFAEASYHSLRGTIKSRWTCENDIFTMEVTVPANTTARISVPCDDPGAYGDITENGSPAGDSEGVAYVASHKDRVEFEVGSGTYRFQSTYTVENR
ncbi:family 78 glycoside hydrolase catalytic domain [Candidatus Latescibacterota bacterium]